MCSGVAMSTYLHLGIEQEEPAPSRPFRGISLSAMDTAIRLASQKTEQINDTHREESSNEKR